MNRRWRRLRRAVLRLLFRGRWRALPMWRVVQRFGTPRRVHDYMQVCFEYAHDHALHGAEDVWQTPRRTFELMRGDCEDFALFAWHVLRLNGYGARILAVFTESDGHAVCVFEERGRYHSVCNQALVAHRLPGRGPDAPGERLARAVAEHFFPGRWTSWSYVERFALVRRPDGAVVSFVPDYRPRRPGSHGT